MVWVEDIEQAAEAAARRWRSWRLGAQAGADALFEFGAFVAIRVVRACHGRPPSWFSA
jgi:hypothetical protein